MARKPRAGPRHANSAAPPRWPPPTASAASTSAIPMARPGQRRRPGADPVSRRAGSCSWLIPPQPPSPFAAGRPRRSRCRRPGRQGHLRGNPQHPIARRRDLRRRRGIHQFDDQVRLGRPGPGAARTPCASTGCAGLRASPRCRATSPAPRRYQSRTSSTSRVRARTRRHDGDLAPGQGIHQGRLAHIRGPVIANTSPPAGARHVRASSRWATDLTS